MTKYLFELFNNDPSLDLTSKTTEIQDAINYINDGKKRKEPVFLGVNISNVNEIKTHSLILDVVSGENSNQACHQKFGWYLANKCNMREFCNPSNKEEMFRITEI